MVTSTLVLALACTLLPGVAAAPSDESEALAQVLESELLGDQLLDVTGASSAHPSDPGEELSPVQLEALELLSLDLGTVNLPLLGTAANPGLLDLGEAGALNAYTTTPTGQNATAGAGAVGADGAITANNPQQPDVPRNTTVRLTHLLSQLEVDGLTADLVQQLDLELGAVASTATQTQPSAPASAYKVSQGILVVNSPAVAEFSRAARTHVTGQVGGTVNALVADGGAIGQLTQGLTSAPLDLDVASLSLSKGTVTTEGLDTALTGAVDSVLNRPVTDPDGLVSVTPAEGTITVDLAKVVRSPDGKTLNGLPPNTEVLTPATIATITEAVSDALGRVADRLGQGVAKTLATTRLTISLPAELQVVLARSTGHLVVSGSLADFAGASGTAPRIEPKMDLLGLSPDLLLIHLTDDLKPLLLTPLQGVVGELLTAAPAEVVSTVRRDLVDPLLGRLSPALEGVLRQAVRLTINSQPSPGLRGSGSLTVRAVSLTLLPADPAAEVHLASSTVRTTSTDPADPVEPVGDPEPDHVTVVQGQEVIFDVLANDGPVAEAAGFTRAQADATPKLIGDATGPAPASTAHGSITCSDNGADRGRCTYQSLDSYTGTDGFDYVLIQPAQVWNVHVDITVVPTNHAPTPREDRAVATTGGDPVVVEPLANDTDPDTDDQLVIEAATTPEDARGDFDCTATACTYTPADDGWTGVIEVPYTLTDQATGGSAPLTATATIRIFVDPAPLNPRGFHDRATAPATATTGQWSQTTTVTAETPVCTNNRPATHISWPPRDGTTGWVLERRLLDPEPGPWQSVAALEAGTTEFIDTRLGESRTYQWRARPDRHRWTGIFSEASAAATQQAATTATGC